MNLLESLQEITEGFLSQSMQCFAEVAVDLESWRAQHQTRQKSTYYLNFLGYTDLTANQYIELPWEKVQYKNEWVYPDTVTFRWKMNPEKIYSYAGYENQTILCNVSILYY